MNLKTRRKYAERFINLFITIAGTLAACLFIEHYFFDETEWMQPFVDRIQGLTGWSVSAIVLLSVAVVYVLAFGVWCWISMVRAVEMTPDQTARWDSLMEELDDKRNGRKERRRA